MAAEIAGIFRDDLNTLVLDSKLLVVGAGGIGCEILKNLVMCGFKDIEIVSFWMFLIVMKFLSFSSKLPD